MSRLESTSGFSWFWPSSVTWSRIQGSGFGVWGMGFRVQGSGFRVQSFGDGVWGLGFGISGWRFRFRVSGIGLQVSSFSFRFWLSGFGFRGSDHRAQGEVDGAAGAVGPRRERHSTTNPHVSTKSMVFRPIDVP